MDGNGQDPALFDHINNALVGDMPSFGMGKESKFQQLMRSHSVTNASAMPQQTQNNHLGRQQLCVEAKEFTPSMAAASHANQQSYVSTVSSFEGMNISGQNGLAQNPNVGVNEFVPRNLSAPNLNLIQAQSPMSGSSVGVSGIKEFIPSSRLTGMAGRPNGVVQQQPGAFLSPQGHRFVPHSNVRAMGDQDMTMGMMNSGMRKANSPMIELMSGLDHHGGSVSSHHLNSTSSVFSPSQPPSAIFYAGGDSDSPLTASPHAEKLLTAKSKVAVTDLKRSLKWIEDNWLRLVTKRKQQTAATTAGYAPAATSSPYTRHSMPTNGTGVSMNPLSRNSSETPDRSSPLQVRRAANMGQRASPLEPLTTEIPIEGEMQRGVAQENFGGTTYFFTQNQNRQNMSVVVPSFHIFPGSPPSVEYMKQKVNAPSFFMSNGLRQALLDKQTLTMLTVDTEQDMTVPAEVDNYHSLYPLEPITDTPLQKSNTFGFVTSTYKAIKYKDGLPYCLRRIHGFRQVNQNCMVLVEMWKKIQHANIVTLREVFTSKAFGEHSLIFSHDYHAGAETLMSRHFQNPNNNYASKAKWNSNGGKQHKGLLAESLIWSYVVQLTSALRCIHAAGLACRVMDPTKIIITDKSRLHVSGVGIFDVLGYDSSHSNPRAHMPQYQQDDLVALGKVVLALACNSVAAIQRENFSQSLDLVVMNYSTDLKNFILYLLTPQQRPRNVNDIMPMIGARFYTQLDAAMMRGDVIENELSKELENGRLFRLMSKLSIVNERPGLGMDTSWSETGDRYLLKLFRDHVFHQVTETGAPWIDMAHIVQCLNKLDAGVPEKVCLMSRDEQNVLVVSYADLKRALTKCFNELMSAGHG